MDLYDCAVFIIDDEPALLDMVKELLIKDGFKNIDTAHNCAEARRSFSTKKYKLILLDVMLPDGDGFSLFEELTSNVSDHRAPVIFLSARDEDYARLKGLGLGADDYITKPFLPEELLLRIKAVLKRTWNFIEHQVNEQIGKAMVDWDAGTIRKDGEDYVLTAKEYVLLKKLCINRGRILSINTLMSTLWPDGSYGYENSLMVHIRRLREKLEENPSKPEYLVTVRGLGYKLK